MKRFRPRPVVSTKLEQWLPGISFMLLARSCRLWALGMNMLEVWCSAGYGRGVWFVGVVSWDEALSMMCLIPWRRRSSSHCDCSLVHRQRHRKAWVIRLTELHLLYVLVIRTNCTLLPSSSLYHSQLLLLLFWPGELFHSWQALRERFDVILDWKQKLPSGIPIFGSDIKHISTFSAGN